MIFDVAMVDYIGTVILYKILILHYSAIFPSLTMIFSNMACRHKCK